MEDWPKLGSDQGEPLRGVWGNSFQQTNSQERGDASGANFQSSSNSYQTSQERVDHNRINHNSGYETKEDEITIANVIQSAIDDVSESETEESDDSESSMSEDLEEQVLVKEGSIIVASLTKEEAFGDAEAVKSSDQQKNDDMFLRHPWEDVLGSKKLFKRIIQEGEGQYVNEYSDKYGQHVAVTIDYRIYLFPEAHDFFQGGEHPCVEPILSAPHGSKTLLDETNMQYVTGEGDQIKALDLILSLMKPKEKVRFFTTPFLAYQDKKYDELEIPAHSSLVCDVTLHSVDVPLDGTDRAVPATAKELYEEAFRKKTKGNNWYSIPNLQYATDSYRAGIRYIINNAVSQEITHDESFRENVNKLKVDLFNNLAAIYIFNGDYQGTSLVSDQVLEIDHLNLKAYYRKVVSLTKLKQLTEALSYVKITQGILNEKPEENDSMWTKSIRKRLPGMEKNIIAQIKLEKKKEKDMAKKMFASTNKVPAPNGTEERHVVEEASNEMDIEDSEESSSNLWWLGALGLAAAAAFGIWKIRN